MQSNSAEINTDDLDELIDRTVVFECIQWPSNLILIPTQISQNELIGGEIPVTNRYRLIGEFLSLFQHLNSHSHLFQLSTHTTQ